MTFDDILEQAIAILQRRGRVTYRTLKRQFDLDDAALEDLKEELLYGQRLAVDEDERVLVWTGDTEAASLPPSRPASAPAANQKPPPISYTPPHLAEKILTTKSALEGERKQVTGLFCDLQNSTPLAEKLGPEAMHTLLNRFFEVALSEVHRYELVDSGADMWALITVSATSGHIRIRADGSSAFRCERLGALPWHNRSSRMAGAMIEADMCMFDAKIGELLGIRGVRLNFRLWHYKPITYLNCLLKS
jgi:hypothetical protein